MANFSTSMPPVVNPPSPYVGSIRLNEGFTVAVQGKVSHHDSFSINFTKSPLAANGDLSDAALHFNPRFNDRAIVRNSMDYGNWGGEERSGGFPLQKGVPFEIIIVVHHHHYKISVNGRHFTDFKHRIAKEQVNYLVITRGAEISFIKFDGQNHPQNPPQNPGFSPVWNPPNAHGPPGHMPPGPPGHMPPGPPGHMPPPYSHNPFQPPPGGMPSGYPGAGGAAPPMYNPAVPLTTGIPGQLGNGRMIFISGIPHPNVTRFTINLNAGSDIAMHFDVRVNFGDTRNEVIRTHRQYGNFGPEERHQTYFPFIPNANFDMIILVEPGCFKIAVNNQHFTEFNHRIPVGSVNSLNIEGDVRLTQVRFQ